MAVVEVVVIVHAHADVAETVELRADLADFAAEHLVVRDHPVLADRLRRGRAGNGQAEMPLAGQRHAIFIRAAQRVDLPVRDELLGLEDLFGRHAVGGAALIVSGPHSEGHHFGPMGVSSAAEARRPTIVVTRKAIKRRCTSLVLSMM